MSGVGIIQEFEGDSLPRKKKMTPPKTKKRSRKCPVCRHYTMYPAGKIKAGPRGGLRTVYACRRCGYRAIH